MNDLTNYKTRITEELKSFSNATEFNFTSVFNKLYSYSYKDYTEDYHAFSSFRTAQNDIYFDLAIKKESAHLQI